ncbi:MAG: two-component sensor histidine kinase [Desulfobacteraceae bacterium]|nr:MAG: two-component sensor histidine kinase [Desulfobacteraceae bacterium]
MESNHFSAIRRILFTCMILVPLVPFILALGTGYYFFTTSLENNTIASMKRIVGDHRQMIESFLEERKHDLDFILYSYTFEDLSQSENLDTVFDHLQRESQAFVDLGVFNEEGFHVAYHGPYSLKGKIYKDTDWFKEVMKHGYYISDIFLGYRQVPHFIIALAKEDAGKKWVIRTTIDTVTFNNIVKGIRIGKTGEAYILNVNGLLQTEPRSGGKLMDKHPDTVKYPSSNIGIETFIAKGLKGETYLYTTTWLQNKKWLLVVRQEKSDAFSALTSAVYLVVLITVIGGAIITVVAFYLTNHIVGRMEKMDVEKERLNQQLIGASRLAELGEMSAGFAHEINNPLQIIKNEQSLMEMILDDMKEAGQITASESLAEFVDSMDQIKLQISRCAKITQAILKFGRQDEPKPQNIDLRSFIPELIGMVAQKASVHGISIEQNIAENTYPIHGDPTQLQQVLLNLFNNAMDAILEQHGTSGGKLVVNTGAKENKTVEIVIKDNGCGISPENLNKIFSPFFTTKSVGKGTGLGLSICYGIIDNMHGTLEVSSEVGVGTTFSIHLPAVV